MRGGISQGLIWGYNPETFLCNWGKTLGNLSKDDRQHVSKAGSSECKANSTNWATVAQQFNCRSCDIEVVKLYCSISRKNRSKCIITLKTVFWSALGKYGGLSPYQIVPQRISWSLTVPISHSFPQRVLVEGRHLQTCDGLSNRRVYDWPISVS